MLLRPRVGMHLKQIGNRTEHLLMNRITVFFISCCILVLAACSTSKTAFNATRKYSQSALQNDYLTFRNILEQYHPSLYWFTPKDSIDYFFNRGYSQIIDSMDEIQFKNILTDVISKVRCGHTSVRYSKKYSHYLDTAKIKAFPLSFKVWSDSMAVIGNINRTDTILKRGTIVHSINGIGTRQFIDTFFNYLVTDGWSVNGKYQSLSTRSNFGVLYRNVLGLPNSFTIEYSDDEGGKKFTTISVYDPEKDTLLRKLPVPKEKNTDAPKRVTVNSRRNVQIDTTLSSAYMTLNTFSRGNKLRSFFRKSFREINNQSIQHLVIDVRSNGGGDAGLSTLLTQYLISKKFKLADSLYAVRRSGPYNQYIKKHFLYRMGMLLVTRKRKDQKYHFVHFEKHYFKPLRKNHFDGDIYIIVGGNSFSATTLFAYALQGQKNVTIVGEETGGGAYGNTAWMIPDVVLPNTKIRFRLPLFRLVMNKERVASGRGIVPDIEAAPTVESIRMGIDPKAEKVKQLIIEKNKLTKRPFSSG